MDKLNRAISRHDEALSEALSSFKQCQRSLKSAVQTEITNSAHRDQSKVREAEKKAKTYIIALNKRVLKNANKLQAGQVPPEFWTTQLPSAKKLAPTLLAAAGDNLQKNDPFVIKDGWF